MSRKSINTPREKAIYEEDLKIVKRRLEAGRKAKADKQAERSSQDAEIITKHPGSKMARRSSGTPSITSPTKPSTSTNRKNFSDEESHPRGTRFSSVSAGTESPRAIKKIYCSTGLFGKSYFLGH
jgi:hypothetical protein